MKNYPDIHNRRVNWRVKSNLNTNDLNLFIRQPYWMNINCTNFKRKFTNRVFCNLLDTSTNCIISYQAIWSTFINQTIITNKVTTMIKFMIFTSLLYLGGLPPFLGFLQKRIFIQAINTNNIAPLATIVVVTSLITLYYYLKTSYSIFIILNTEPK